MDTVPNPGSSSGTDITNDVESLRAEVADLKARVESYERILQMRDAALAATAFSPPAAMVGVAVAHAKPDLPAIFKIAADQLLPTQDGFYQLEWGPEGAFRWTGPSEDVHFEAWIDRSVPLVATFHLFHFGTPANAREMTIEADGQRYALLREGTGKTLRSESIAPRPGDGPTRITLHVPHTHSPSEHGAADKRRLGVAFQRLRLARD